MGYTTELLSELIKIFDEIHEFKILFSLEAAKYAKRVIESNWSKYELPPSDEEVILIHYYLFYPGDRYQHH